MKFFITTVARVSTTAAKETFRANLNEKFLAVYNKMVKNSENKLEDPRYKTLVKSTDQTKVKELLDEVEESSKKLSVY